MYPSTEEWINCDISIQWNTAYQKKKKRNKLFVHAAIWQSSKTLCGMELVRGKSIIPCIIYTVLEKTNHTTVIDRNQNRGFLCLEGVGRILTRKGHQGT